MTDCNVNKMNAQAQVKPDPDDSGTLPSATPPSGPLPTGAETLAHLPDGADASTLADVTPNANPLLGVATPATLEEDLRDLAAHNPEVQLTETHCIHVGALALTSLPVPSGSQDQQQALAHRAPTDARCYHPPGGKGSCGQYPG